MDESSNKKRKLFNKRFIRIIIAACTVILFYFIIKNLGAIPKGLKSFAVIISPFIIGGSMAFVLNPLVMFFEKLLKKFIKKPKTKRALATIITIFLIVFIIWSVINIIIPIISEGIGGLFSDLVLLFSKWATDLQEYVSEKSVSDFFTANQIENLKSSVVSIVSGAFNITSDVFLKLISTTGSIANGFINVILGTVVSLYLLLGKEHFLAQFRKFINAILKPDAVKEVENFGRLSSTLVSKFITGQLTDAGIVGVLCFVLLFILSLFGLITAPMSYLLLISLLIAMTNVIPYFGPFIGAIPSAIILLTVSLKDTIVFLILIFVIQQIDGNIINPKIMGESTGVEGIWVMFSVTVGSALFGIPGMFFGVPVFALIYYYVDRFTEKSLERKGLPTDTNAYLAVASELSSDKTRDDKK